MMFKTKIVAFVGFSAAYLFFYILPNLHPLYSPFTLPLLWIDLWVPFIPWTFLVYLSDYALAFSVVFILKERDEVYSLIRTFFMGLAICGLFFLLFPTTYPRPQQLSLETTPWWISFPMTLVHSADTPNNCFPSLHVTVAMLAAWSLRGRGKLFRSYCVWSVAISLSTLTTKQHYFLDILGGISVATLAAYLDWAYSVRCKTRPLPQKEILNKSFNVNRLK